MAKKYVVRLTDSERETLSHLIKKQRVAAQRVLRAQVLLKADADGPMWTDAKIAEAFGCRTQTVENIRERFVAEGFDVTLNGKPKRRVRGKISRRRARGQDHRVAVGAAAERVRELDVAAVGRTSRGAGDRGVGQPRDRASHAKKNGMTKRKIEYWVIPPEADAEFAASMEEVLDVYARPYDPRLPVLCMDEQPMQLLKETRKPIAATRKHPRRVDYEYERAGTASIFMFCEPLAGWRQVTVRERRTKIDWAQEVEELLRDALRVGEEGDSWSATT